MLKLALIFGGKSSEHSVSCVTALGVHEAIDQSKYEIIPVGITPSGRFVLEPVNLDWQLSGWPKVSEDSPELLLPVGGGELRMAATGMSLGKIDIAFPVLHGLNGEDGSIQGLLQLCKIPYVGNGVLASALAMNKAIAKSTFRDAGIPVAKDMVITRSEWQLNREQILKSAGKFLNPSCFVKPSRSGSSVGVTKAHDLLELETGIEEALGHDNTALVEEHVIGREIECSVLEHPGGELQVSLAGEIVVAGDGFYDYDNKYLGSGAELKVPTELTKKELAQMHELAIKAFKAAGCSGLARTDFFLTKKGLVLTEINTLPGFTPISMYPALFAASGVKYADLIETLIARGIELGYEPR